MGFWVFGGFWGSKIPKNPVGFWVFGVFENKAQLNTGGAPGSLKHPERGFKQRINFNRAVN